MFWKLKYFSNIKCHSGLERAVIEDMASERGDMGRPAWRLTWDRYFRGESAWGRVDQHGE